MVCRLGVKSAEKRPKNDEKTGLFAVCLPHGVPFVCRDILQSDGYKRFNFAAWRAVCGKTGSGTAFLTLTAGAWMTEYRKRKHGGFYMSDDGMTAAGAGVPAAPQQTTGLAACYAAGCRFNRNGQCSFIGIEIGKGGGCMSFEERTEEQLRQYLVARGLPEAAIQQILQEAAKHGGTD